MTYLGIALILFIAYLIQHFDDKIGEKQNKRIEELHADAYKWIDENTSNSAVARERKAEIDTLINNCVESQGRKYSPRELKQTATKKERKARNEATASGKQYVSDDMAYAVMAYVLRDKPTAEEVWEYTEHTEEEKREHYIGCLMRKLGISREEAERKADKFKARESDYGKDTHK